MSTTARHATTTTARDDLHLRVGRRLPSPRLLLVLGVGYLLLAWALVLLVDVYDVAGLRARLGRNSGAPFWVHLFAESSPTEWVQTLFLFGALASLAVFVGLAVRGQDERWAGFGALLALGVVLMLFEDTGNVGQRIGGYVGDIVGADSEWVDYARLPMFALAGGVPLFALWRYRHLLRSATRRPIAFVVAGLGTYAFMAVTSELLALNIGGWFDFYGKSGDALLQGAFGGRLILLSETGLENFEGTSARDTAVFFMDYVYEESFELIGAMLLCIGCVLLLRHALSRPPEASVSPVAPATEAADEGRDDASGEQAGVEFASEYSADERSADGRHRRRTRSS